MAASALLTLRLSRQTNQRLAKLARSTDRTRSRLAAEAIEKYLDDSAWQVASIEEGIAAADRGELVNHDDVVRWVKSWGRRDELKKPR